MRLLIKSRQEAEKLLTWIPDLKGLVSIYGSPKSRLSAWEEGKTQPCMGFDAFVGPKLALMFDDALPTEDKEVFPPTLKQIQGLLEWGRAVDFNADGAFMVHCGAGIARSAACMLALLCQHMGEEHERAALDECYKTSGFIWPNDLIVQLADEVLDRKGKLISVVQQWKEAKRGKISI